MVKKTLEVKVKKGIEPHFQIFRIPLLWGILLRLGLWYYYPSLSQRLDDRVEITTPITSLKRRKILIFI